MNTCPLCHKELIFKYDPEQFVCPDIINIPDYDDTDLHHYYEWGDMDKNIVSFPFYVDIQEDGIFYKLYSKENGWTVFETEIPNTIDGIINKLIRLSKLKTFI